jgi:outer membrane protein assembly factor BamB/orotate phosphoribosyltransferase
LKNIQSISGLVAGRALPYPVHPDDFSRIRQSPEWDLLRRQIVDKAIYFSDQLVFDIRRMLTQSRNAEMAGRLMWQLIKPHQPQVLIGPGFGASPLLYSTALAALADGAELQVLMVRDKRKAHNQKRWVEGDHASAAGKRAVMLDDFMKAGSALPLVRDALRADSIRLDIVALALFFDMWEPLGSRQISTSQLPVLSLFTRHDIGLSRDCHDAVPPLMKGSAPDFLVDTPRWWRMGLNKSLAYPTKCAPVMADDAVFIADEKSTLWKHDLGTGNIRWSVPSLETPQKGIVQKLQYVQGSLVYGCYDGTLTKVNAETGAIQWRWKIDSSIHATPTLDEAGGRIFVNTEQWNGGRPCGHLQCLELATGRLLWKHRHAWWPPGTAAYCVATSLVVAPCNDESFTALDAASGRVAWRFKTEGMVRGQPLIKAMQGKSRLYAATERGRLHCLDTATGELIWTRRYGQGLWHQFLVADETSVFVMDGKWHFTAFDLDSGATRWLGRLRSPGCWQPVWCGAFLVVLSRQGHLAVFDPAREVKVWEGRIPGTYHQPPAVALDASGTAVLVAASSSSGLLAFDIHAHYAGSIAPSQQTPRDMTPQPPTETTPV